ncbi:hypothetical protein BD324DRAFT_629706 [Kockovaella imperatae]|uniref:PX domain-containing protein n=1 Tax=Kockovaella imperatae TaxID=4999 RepID=A0A1Y1UEL0_9TREE|nr:hypothetical protein BD324DRAFT_629706 [Kockovaella imperatae]ORX35967.1 hypothetical protein BD324DRAFT_629706 [Kockovaella imperatae]
MEDATSGPDPFSASPSQSGANTPQRAESSAPSTTSSPPPRASTSSPIPTVVTRRLSTTNSHFSAASGSPPPTHRASFPDPSKEPKRGSSRLSGPPAKEGFCCERDKEIAKGEDVSIIDAFKTTEGGTATYITYVIRLGSHTTRRRYSAFLSLHQALTGLYPVLIIPPIPSKQSIADYAVKGQTKAKEDATVIARRKRLLEDFLRRLIRHPILGGEHVLHRFLEDGVSWSEVLHSPPISLLPKSPLHAPSHNPTFQGSDQSPSSSPQSSTAPTYIAHHLIPTPSPNHPLKHPDTRFMDSEIFTEKFQAHFSGTMEKVNRRTVKRWGERAGDLSELGAVWNGFSLVESGKLGEAVEKVGQAVDSEYLATAALLQAWEQTTTEPLHIYAQFASLIRSRLAFRHQKHVQFELVQDALENQKDKLDVLENAEKEARRLNDALERGGSRLLGQAVDGVSSDENAEQLRERALERERERERDRERQERIARGSRKSGSSFGLLNAVKHSLSGMMDVDPEATRRANIAKTRDNISQLEDSLQASAQDLKYASTTLQADLDRFQRQKVADLRQLTIQLSKVHHEWCRQNLEAWQAAQAAIREVEPHPSRPPAPEQPELPPKSDNVGTSLAMGGLQSELDRIEASNKPLPLPEGEGILDANEDTGVRQASSGEAPGPL